MSSLSETQRRSSETKPEGSSVKATHSETKQEVLARRAFNAASRTRR
ncbi:hypothetical protein A2U01_0088569, partial [Trifolium medium]|nr:hypothetical protein [Trifolium medium]